MDEERARTRLSVRSEIRVACWQAGVVALLLATLIGINVWNSVEISRTKASLDDLETSTSAKVAALRHSYATVAATVGELSSQTIDPSAVINDGLASAKRIERLNISSEIQNGTMSYVFVYKIFGNGSDTNGTLVELRDLRSFLVEEVDPDDSLQAVKLCHVDRPQMCSGLKAPRNATEDILYEFPGGNGPTGACLGTLGTEDGRLAWFEFDAQLPFSNETGIFSSVVSGTSSGSFDVALSVQGPYQFATVVYSVRMNAGVSSFATPSLSLQTEGAYDRPGVALYHHHLVTYTEVGGAGQGVTDAHMLLPSNSSVVTVGLPGFTPTSNPFDVVGHTSFFWRRDW